MKPSLADMWRQLRSSARAELDMTFGPIGAVALWLVMAAPTALVLLSGQADGAAVWQLVVALAVLAAAVVFSYRVPIVSLLLTIPLWAAGDVGDAGSTSLQNTPFALSTALMCYLVGRRIPSVLTALVTFSALLVGVTVLSLVLPPSAIAWFSLVMYLLFFGVLPWLLGRYRRQYRRLIIGGWERAERLEREQRMLAEQAKLRERSRIAQDMHDSLGHELSLIALLSGSLEMAKSLTREHREAATELRSRAVTAIERLHEAIGVLREDSEHPPAEPVGEPVQQLLERARTSGVSVRLVEDDGLPEPPPLVDRAVYRVVQESLTNATKHAPGADVTVRIGEEAGRIVVSVTNGPATREPLPGGTDGRHGLVGLRERVRLAGGTFHAEPTERGGFEVVARMPLDPADVPADVGGAERAGADLESTHQRQHVERRVRRSLIAAIAVPAVISAGLALVIGGLFVFQTLNSVLEPEEYAQLRVGQQRGTIASLLPSQQYLERPENMVEPPVPPGATCEYYRSSSNVLVDAGVYRLCFTGGRLMAKDLLSPSGTGTTP